MRMCPVCFLVPRMVVTPLLSIPTVGDPEGSTTAWINQLGLHGVYAAGMQGVEVVIKVPGDRYPNLRPPPGCKFANTGSSWSANNAAAASPMASNPGVCADKACSSVGGGRISKSGCRSNVDLTTDFLRRRSRPVL